jgi:hypothetical protein
MGTKLRNATGELDVSPWQALLQEVRRAAYRAAWLDQQLDAEAQRYVELEHETEQADRWAGAAEVRRWTEESRRERAHLARVTKTAIDAGLAERYVQSIEADARLITRIVGKAIGVLDLTPEQQLDVSAALREALREASTELNTRHAVEGGGAQPRALGR